MLPARVVVLATTGVEADERVIREYVVPEWDRLTGIDGCEGLRFSRYGSDPRTDHGAVHLAIFGDHDAVIERERDRWDAMRDSEHVIGWYLTGVSWADWPAAQAGMMRRLQVLASEMSVAYYRSDPDTPAPVDAFPAAERSLGWWVLLHFLINQAGYSPDEELAICARLLDNRLREFASLHDPARAIERLEDLQARLDAVRADLEGRSCSESG